MASTEQHVLQQIVPARNSEPMQWAPEGSRAELDIAIEHSETWVPIEVKAAEPLQLKSLHGCIERFCPVDASRFSPSDYRQQDEMTDVPHCTIDPLLSQDSTHN